jgi:hypothetical protein
MTVGGQQVSERKPTQQSGLQAHGAAGSVLRQSGQEVCLVLGYSTGASSGCFLRLADMDLSRVTGMRVMLAAATPASILPWLVSCCL